MWKRLNRVGMGNIDIEGNPKISGHAERCVGLLFEWGACFDDKDHKFHFADFKFVTLQQRTGWSSLYSNMEAKIRDLNMLGSWRCLKLCWDFIS